jgi:hypothetical protein
MGRRNERVNPSTALRLVRRATLLVATCLCACDALIGLTQPTFLGQSGDAGDLDAGSDGPSSGEVVDAAAESLDSGTATRMDASDSGDSSDVTVDAAGDADASSIDAATAPDSSADDAGPPPCAALPGTVVYVEAGNTEELLLKLIGRQLRDNADITVAFELVNSCDLVSNLYLSTPIPPGTTLLYVPSTIEDPGWTTSDAERTCTTSLAETPASLGISSIFPSSCPGANPPAFIGNFEGPVRAYGFVVLAPWAATDLAIWAEEAYYAFGDGANNPVLYGGEPEWNDPTDFFLRPLTSGGLMAVAPNIDLSPAQLTLELPDGGSLDGRQLEPSWNAVFSGMLVTPGPGTIGLLPGDLYDTRRGSGISLLPFRAFGQTHAFYPDSTAISFDKQNVRDGHYTLWSPTMLLAVTDGATTPTDPAVSYIVAAVTGTPGATPPDGGIPIDGLGAVAAAGLTPTCAMQVQRASDGAPLTPYTPVAPCTCYFLSKAPAPALPASCVACSTSAPCATGACFNGFCEVPPAPPLDAGENCGTTEDGGYDAIINACTNATAVDKTNVVLPITDGGLLPVDP